MTVENLRRDIYDAFDFFKRFCPLEELFEELIPKYPLIPEKVVFDEIKKQCNIYQVMNILGEESFYAVLKK